jgi:predicted ester cyclase
LVETDGKVGVAFRLRGRQVGTLTTPLGGLPPTGRIIDLRVIDILTITDGRISDVWMAADELGALAATRG